LGAFFGIGRAGCGFPDLGIFGVLGMVRSSFISVKGESLVVLDGVFVVLILVIEILVVQIVVSLNGVEVVVRLFHLIHFG
jgi:hypothetical protein